MTEAAISYYEFLELLDTSLSKRSPFYWDTLIVPLRGTPSWEDNGEPINKTLTKQWNRWRKNNQLHERGAEIWVIPPYYNGDLMTEEDWQDDGNVWQLGEPK